MYLNRSLFSMAREALTSKMSPSSNEIKAIHWLLILSRNLAYSGADGKKIADILDYAEYLVGMWLDNKPLIGEGYSTHEEKFRFYLDGLEKKHPELRGIVRRFDTE